MIVDPGFYALAIPAVVLMGLSKGGLAGVGALSLPMLVFAISPVQAAAILLPLLIVQDAVSVWAFRRAVDRFVLMWMLPGAVLGIAGGYLFAASVSPSIVIGAVGGISALFGGYRLWVEHHPAQRATSSARPSLAASGWVGALAGVVTGLTSQVRMPAGPRSRCGCCPVACRRRCWRGLRRCSSRS